jgi:hypothetical protein
MRRRNFIASLVSAVVLGASESLGVVPPVVYRKWTIEEILEREAYIIQADIIKRLAKEDPWVKLYSGNAKPKR